MGQLKWSGVFMAVLLFDCPLDEATMTSIHELRLLRLEVLNRQIRDIDRVLDTLMQQGALIEEEKSAYRVIVLEELRLKSLELEQRLKTPETFHMEELELYIDVLSVNAKEG